MKTIAILGSTGSIGTQTLEIARTNGDIRVAALSAGKNIRLLEAQIREFRPRLAAVWAEEDAKRLREAVRDVNVQILSGMEGLIAVAEWEESQILVTAIVGMIGIRPTIAAIKAGKDIALANKETLVTAGHIIMPLAAEKGVRILPVDSEHSAIFQCLQGVCTPETSVRYGTGTQTSDGSSHDADVRPSTGSMNDADAQIAADPQSFDKPGTASGRKTAGAEQVGRQKYPGLDKILLTASGGPFRGKTLDELRGMHVEDALKHPNWSMGQKITIDSASMVNKGLEVMEARWLFGVELDQIQVVVQPQSVIHSMVQFTDGAVLAQLGTPDMKLPISYALYYPHRRYLGGPRLDFAALSRITFEDPDMETFSGLRYALEAAHRGGSMPTVFNAANERAVARFLERRISFTQIYEIIRDCMDHHTVIPNPDVSEILDVEQTVYERIESRW